ncbi:MAG TPA: type II secretion system F family protein, partial [Candidatus Brocadiia bacterium]|nr:type II secretion system F family protein [Candidatus Brocadiia bacterium]
MATFDYIAMDNAGRQTQGSVSADGRAGAIEAVAALGLRPMSVTERAMAGKAKRPAGRPGRVSQASVESFTRQLASLLAAGVSLSKALQILAREASQSSAKAMWVAIHDDVVGGMSLADALGKRPQAFPPVYVAMVRAGETGGFLEVVLEQIADFRTREQDLKGRVKAALIYPAVLAAVAAGVMVFLLTFFIPRFSTIFAEFGEALPWLTRVIVAVSSAALRYGVWILAAAALVAVALKRALDTAEGRRVFERVTLAAPAAGRVVARFAL